MPASSFRVFSTFRGFKLLRSCEPNLVAAVNCGDSKLAFVFSLKTRYARNLKRMQKLPGACLNLILRHRYFSRVFKKRLKWVFWTFLKPFCSRQAKVVVRQVQVVAAVAVGAPDQAEVFACLPLTRCRNPAKVASAT
jgi:hypothetical protein